MGILTDHGGVRDVNIGLTLIGAVIAVRAVDNPMATPHRRDQSIRRARKVMRAALWPIFFGARSAAKPAAASLPIISSSV